MNDWIAISETEPLDGQIVETKIDDAHGGHNEALLVRRNNLWCFAIESVYVYYEPTHYRKPLAADIKEELNRLTTQAGQVDSVRKRLAATETRD